MPADQIIGAYSAQIARLRQRVLFYVQVAWGGLGSYDRDDIERFVNAVVPVVAGGQMQVAALTDGYLAYLEADVLGGPPRPVGIPPEVVSDEAMRGVPASEVYARVGPTVWKGLKDGKLLAQAVEEASQRLVKVAASDLQLAKTHASRFSLTRNERVVGYMRVTHGKTCGLCIAASTQRYHRGDLLPMHPACVVGGTVVSGPQAVKGTSRRYEGEVVVLGTASGDFLTITPNHPVLAPHGWVPAGLLREGDYVVRSVGGQRVAGGSPHEHQVPARIEDRFRALAVQALVSVPLAAQDFHGDGPHGHVGVVPTDCLLGYGVPASLLDPLGQDPLTWGTEGALPFAGSGDLATLLFGMHSPAGSLMGSYGLGLALLGGHAFGSVPTGVFRASDGNASGKDATPYHGSADSQGYGQGIFGLACLVAGNEIVRHGDPRSAASATNFDAPGVEFAGEGRLGYADRGRRLLDRIACQVQPDRVVTIGRRDNASAHVYNLQTVEGWYAANGLIVSNCDCSVEPIYGQRDTGQVINRDRLDRLKGALGEGATSPATGKPLQYRDVLVEEHGELGPVLTIRGQKFTGPSDI